MSATMSEKVPLMCQLRKTMQRSVVSQVNSICVCQPRMYHLVVWSSAAPALAVQRTFMLHLWPWSMPGMSWSMWP